jgi:hypothetical protein
MIAGEKEGKSLSISLAREKCCTVIALPYANVNSQILY